MLHPSKQNNQGNGRQQMYPYAETDNGYLAAIG